MVTVRHVADRWDVRTVNGDVSGGLGARNLAPVTGADDMDAVAWALVGRGDHVQPQVCRHIGATAGAGEKVVPLLDISQTIHVELKDLWRVLDTKTVAGTQVLVDPDP